MKSVKVRKKVKLWPKFFGAFVTSIFILLFFLIDNYLVEPQVIKFFQKKGWRYSHYNRISISIAGLIVFCPILLFAFFLIFYFENKNNPKKSKP